MSTLEAGAGAGAGAGARSEKREAGGGESSEDVEGEDFAGLALGDDLEGAAADLAVGGEALLGLGGVEDQLEALATEGAGDVRRAFHAW